MSSFSESDINAFEDRAIIARIHQQRHSLFKSFSSFTRHMCPYFLGIEGSWRRRLWACSYDAFLWGYFTATTRTVTYKNLIIPLMDFRNFISTDSVRTLSSTHSFDTVLPRADV